MWNMDIMKSEIGTEYIPYSIQVLMLVVGPRWCTGIFVLHICVVTVFRHLSCLFVKQKNAISLS
jgi:hypothetical protein